MAKRALDPGWRHDHGQDLSLGEKLGLLVQEAGLAHRQAGPGLEQQEALVVPRFCSLGKNSVWAREAAACIQIPSQLCFRAVTRGKQLNASLAYFLMELVTALEE